jgi:rod shape-determining protein MreB
VRNQSDEIAAVGNQARDMVGRTPTELSTGSTAEGLPYRGLQHDRASAGSPDPHGPQAQQFVYPRVIIGVPAETTQVESRALVDSHHSQARKSHLVHQSVVAATRAGLPVTSPTATWVLSVAVISLAVLFTRVLYGLPATPWTQPSPTISSTNTA